MKLNNVILIRNWAKGDFQTVRDILLTTWKDTYSFIPEKDLLFHFEKYYNKERMIEILNNPSTKGIIAEVDSITAGWMKLFDDAVNKKFFVSSLYVLPVYQGFGIGKKLLNTAYASAASKNYNKVWLGVMKQNVKSLEWYKNLGFIFAEEEPFKMGETEVLHLIGYKEIESTI